VRQAAAIGIVTGHVRNADPRTVEAVVQGTPAEVARLLAWFRHGPPGARVERFLADETKVDPGCGPFTIIY